MVNSRQEADMVTNKQVADQLDSMSSSDKRKFADWFNGFIVEECECENLGSECGSCEIDDT